LARGFHSAAAAAARFHPTNMASRAEKIGEIGLVCEFCCCWMMMIKVMHDFMNYKKHKI